MDPQPRMASPAPSSQASSRPSSRPSSRRSTPAQEKPEFDERDELEENSTRESTSELEESDTSTHSTAQDTDPDPEADPEEEMPPFRLADIPDKGKGLIATFPIPKGKLILLETPLFILSEERCTNSAVLVALAARTREEQRDFFTLANAYGGAAPRDVSSSPSPESSPDSKCAMKISPRAVRRPLPALGIFDTNALPIPTTDAKGNPQTDLGLFLLGSRFNHSCTPNVARTWDAAAKAMAFRVLRAVEPGEELCTNYVDVLGTRAERAAELEEKYAFACLCSVCVASKEEGVESDRRRSKIGRLFEEVGRCGKEPTLGMRKLKIALRLLKEEGLVHYEASFCFDAFQFCVLVSDIPNAKAWVRKAWEATCNISGPESASARNFKMYWANPRAHQLTGMLPRLTLSGPDP